MMNAATASAASIIRDMPAPPPAPLPKLKVGAKFADDEALEGVAKVRLGSGTATASILE